MAAERSDPSKTGDTEKASADSTPASSGPAAASPLKTWLPLVVNVVLMPVLAYMTVTLFLLPKLKSDHRSSAVPEPASKSESPAAHGESNPGVAKGKFNVPLGGKILVNIAGTMGTRYLLVNVTLVSPQPALKEVVEKNDAELHDVAGGVLASKTIADLEKPGARNLIRTELLSVFNNVLGDGMVTELYITEFAIQ